MKHKAWANNNFNKRGKHIKKSVSSSGSKASIQKRLVAWFHIRCIQDKGKVNNWIWPISLSHNWSSAETARLIENMIDLTMLQPRIVYSTNLLSEERLMGLRVGPSMILHEVVWFQLVSMISQDTSLHIGSQMMSNWRNLIPTLIKFPSEVQTPVNCNGRPWRRNFLRNIRDGANLVKWTQRLFLIFAIHCHIWFTCCSKWWRGTPFSWVKLFVFGQQQSQQTT